MKLFNKTIDRQLFRQYTYGSDLSKQEVVVKIFNPAGNGRWFILNSDPQDPDYLWAIVDLGYGAEVGSVSRSELENYKGRFGLGFERDLEFGHMNAEEVYQGLRQGNYYADGGGLESFGEKIKDDKGLFYWKSKEDGKIRISSGNGSVYFLEFNTLPEAEAYVKKVNAKTPNFFSSTYAKGGNIENFSDNQQMIMNQNVELEHHHEELEDILENKMPVPAWVVAKMETATQNLSDITHYLDGQKEIMEEELEGNDDDDDDDDNDDEMSMQEIENKVVVEPIIVTAGTKTELTKNFTDDAFGNLKGFLKGFEGIDLREDYTFDYKDEQYEIEPIINSDENGVSNAVFSVFNGDGDEVGEITYSSDGGKQKFTANSELFVWNNAKFEDGGFMNGVYADGGYFDGAIPNTSSYMSNYAKGGEVENYRTLSFKTRAIAEKNKKDLETYFGERFSNSMISKGIDERGNDGFFVEYSLKKENYAKGGEIAKAEILGLKRNIMGTTDIEMKITGMRKPQDFIVYPIGADDAGNVIKIQSDTRIGQINLVKGVGVMSQSHQGGAYFVHLQMDKLTSFELSEKDLKDLKAFINKTSGSNVGSSMIKPDNSGASRIFAKGGQIPDWLFIGVYPNAYIFADKRIDNNGYYHEIGRIVFNPFQIRIFDNSSKYASAIEIINKEAKELEKQGYVEISATGQRVDIKKMSNGGSFDKLKWQEVEIGDSARVKEINRMGLVVKTYGRKFHLKFPNGTEKTFDASDLEFFKLEKDQYEMDKNNNFAKGGTLKNEELKVNDKFKFLNNNDIYTIIKVYGSSGDLLVHDQDGYQNVFNPKELKGKINKTYNYGNLGELEQTQYVLFKTEKDLKKITDVLNEYDGYTNESDRIRNRNKLYHNVDGKMMILFSNSAVDMILDLSRGYGVEVEKYGKENDYNYAKGGSVKKDWWQTVVNPNEDFNNFDDKMPIDWDVDDFKSWVVSNSDLDGNVDKEVLDVVKMPKSKLTVEYLNKNGSGKNNNEYYKEFGNWQSALYDVFTQIKKDYLFKKERKYILKSDIKTVTVKRKGKEVTYNGSDVLNGAYVLAKGGDMTSKANYVGKNDVIEVELKDGSKVKPANGYWIKKGAEPISNEPTPNPSAKTETKVGETYIRKDMRNNWKAETNVDDFNGYDWRVSTIKTYSGKLISSTQGGKTEPTGTKGYEIFKYTMYEDPNYTLEVSTPKRLTEKLVSEQHDKALAKFKKFMETGTFKGGGKISNFDKLSAKVAKQYEGKPVKSQYQEEYGKYYSKEEAQEVGDKVAGKMKAMQTAKKEMGGKTEKKENGGRISMKLANQLAKEIRKDGESWNDAKKRAFAQLKK
jgi:hypothetical protein